MNGTELVFAAPLKSPSHMAAPVVEQPFHGGERRAIALDDVRRWGKLTCEGDFVTHLVAEVGDRLYAIDGAGRTDAEAKAIRKACRGFSAMWPRGRGWGFCIAMSDGKPAPPIRTLTNGA